MESLRVGWAVISKDGKVLGLRRREHFAKELARGWGGERLGVRVEPAYVNLMPETATTEV